jgi:hypothetical protein
VVSVMDPTGATAPSPTLAVTVTLLSKGLKSLLPTIRPLSAMFKNTLKFNSAPRICLTMWCLCPLQVIVHLHV